MTVHIALLRAINLAGHNKVAMPELRALLESLGFTAVRSLLQSGNLVFDSDGPKGAALERLLETETAKRLGLRTDYLVRTAAEWRRLVAGNPLPDEARRDPGHLVLVALKQAPAAKAVAALQAAVKGPEVVRCAGRHAYIHYAAGIGRSKLTSAMIEKHLGCRGTARNWNTVLKLAALARAEA